MCILPTVQVLSAEPASCTWVGKGLITDDGVGEADARLDEFSRWVADACGGGRRRCTLEAVATSPETAELVDGWWEYHRLASGTRPQRKALEAGSPEAAVAGRDAVMEAMEAGGLAALSLVLALLDAAPEDDDVALVGAGPLEELLHGHGVSLRQDVEAVARRDAGRRSLYGES